jgi:membrane protease subunit (stomatin/prohibitin family)
MADHEIQNGAVLTVHVLQMAVFVNEGQVADVFGPGRHTLTTQTLPLLTNLKHWDKLFASPFKSDVWFFGTRLQTDQPRTSARCGCAPSATARPSSPRSSRRRWRPRSRASA